MVRSLRVERRTRMRALYWLQSGPIYSRCLSCEALGKMKWSPSTNSLLREVGSRYTPPPHPIILLKIPMSFDCIAQSNGSRSRIHAARLWLGLVGGLDFFTFSPEAQADVKARPECFVNHVRTEVCEIVNEPLSPPGAS